MATLAVIGVHVSMEFTHFPEVNALLIANAWAMSVLQFAVPLFLFISGLVLSFKQDPPETAAFFYRRRAWRIIPPYLFWSLPYLVRSAHQAGRLDGIRIGLEIVAGATHYHMWFVVVLAQCYLLFPLFMRIVRWARTPRRRFGLLLAAFFLQAGWMAVGAYGGDRLPLPSTEFLVDRVFLIHGFYFMAGLLAGRHVDQVRAWVRSLPLLPLFLVFLLATSVATWHWIDGIQRYGSFDPCHLEYQLHILWINPFLIISSSLLCWRWASRIRRVPGVAIRILTEASRCSYGMYLLHAFCHEQVRQGLEALGFSPAGGLYYPLAFALAVGTTWLVVRGVESLPGLALLAGTRKLSILEKGSDLESCA